MFISLFRKLFGTSLLSLSLSLPFRWRGVNIKDLICANTPTLWHLCSSACFSVGSLQLITQLHFFNRTFSNATFILQSSLSEASWSHCSAAPWSQEAQNGRHFIKNPEGTQLTNLFHICFITLIMTRTQSTFFCN